MNHFRHNVGYLLAKHFLDQLQIFISCIGTVDNHENKKAMFPGSCRVFHVWLYFLQFVVFFALFWLFRSFCSLNQDLILILLFMAFKLTYYFYWATFTEVTSLNHFRFSVYIR